MAFKHYSSGTATHPADAYFRGDTVVTRPNPVFAACLAARGSELVMIEPVGLLASRTATDPLDVLLGDGVGYIRPTNGARPALLVWTSRSNVSWESDRRLLRMTEGYGPRGSVTLLLRVDASIDVFTASENDSDDDVVWVAQIFRIRGYSGAGEPPKYLYSKAPVKPQYWPFVQSTSVRQTPDRVEWTVQFLGNVTASFWLPLGDSRLVDAAGPQHAEKTCGVAIWPPKLIPGWRFYTVIGELVFIRPGTRVDFWLGRAGSQPTHLATSDEVIGNNERLALRLKDGSLGPRYVQLSNGDAAGYFELLSEEATTGTITRPVAIDFGTSATTVATEQDNAPIPVDLGSFSAMAKPKVIVSNDPSGLAINPIWLPTVLSTMFGETVGDLRQIPSGLYKRLDDGSPASNVPFLGYTFVSGSFDLDKAAQSVTAWSADLKWQRAIGAASGSGAGDAEADRRKFFIALLTWISALIRERASGIELRATYPLAFTRSEINGYGTTLKEVTAAVYELTGMQTTIPNPYFRIDAADQSRPFVDESTPLLNGALTHFNVANAKGEPFVFVADLGGETLDVQLVAISRQKHDNSYRIVACESVRIGANCVVEYLQKLVTATYDPPRPSSETAAIVRTILNRVIRTGQLPSALRAGANVPLAMNCSVSWRSADGPRSFINQLDCYFGVLVEYCARFLAGTLRNRDGLRARLKVGPGPGIVSDRFLESNPTIYAVQPYLIGNGWKMLSLFLESIAGASIDDPMKWVTEIFFRRVSELLDPEKLEIVEKDPDQASLFMDKTLTALGTIRLGPGEPQRDGMITSVLAAPNGYEDRSDARQYSWSTLVGAGGENIPHAMQNELLVAPPLPDAQKLTVTGAGAQWYHKLSNRGVPGRKDDLIRVRKLQENQSSGNARERREVSAARAAWEMVLRPELLQLG